MNYPPATRKPQNSKTYHHKGTQVRKKYFLPCVLSIHCPPLRRKLLLYFDIILIVLLISS